MMKASETRLRLVPLGLPGSQSIELKDGLGGSAIGLEAPEPVWRVLHPFPPSRQRHRRDASVAELPVASRSPQLERLRSGQVWESVQDCQNVRGQALPTRPERRLSHPGEVGEEFVGLGASDVASEFEQPAHLGDRSITRTET